LTADATVGGTGSLALSGDISGAFALSKAGSGTLTLSGSNTYSGTTTVSAGTLALASVSAIANTGAVILDTSGANLTLSADKTVGSLAGVAGTTVTLGSHRLTAGDANDTTFAGAMVGTGGLTKAGAGSLTLSGTNTYTGTTTVSAGNLTLSGASAIANTGAVNLDTSGANLTLSANVAIGSLAGVTGTTVNLGSHTLTSGEANNTALAGALGGTGAVVTAPVETFVILDAFINAPFISFSTSTTSPIAHEGALNIKNSFPCEIIGIMLGYIADEAVSCA
jgi:autotransporter-associated beta strand protein